MQDDGRAACAGRRRTRGAVGRGARAAGRARSTAGSARVDRAARASSRGSARGLGPAADARCLRRAARGVAMSATTYAIAAARLSTMLTELRLPTIKRMAAQLCDQADCEGWPGRRLLEILLEHELAERETRRIDRHRAESGLSPDKRLSSFEFAAVPSVSKAQVMALAEGHEWLDRGANVLLFGPPGVGKSHLVCGLGHALIEAGRRVLFTRCSDLVQRLQAARRDLRLPQELTRLDRFDLLILDDLSYVRRDQAETSVL